EPHLAWISSWAIILAALPSLWSLQIPSRQLWKGQPCPPLQPPKQTPPLGQASLPKNRHLLRLKISSLISKPLFHVPAVSAVMPPFPKFRNQLINQISAKLWASLKLCHGSRTKMCSVRFYLGDGLSLIR